jgi:hypothetical protein
MSKFIAVIFYVILFCATAFGSGGTCPASSTYNNPNAAGTGTGTLSSFGITSCFFIDPVGGSDSNDGLSEVSGHPWAHAPGMSNCASVCASTTPANSEGFIFEGGEVETSAAFNTWVWNWSGSSGHVIYIGYDPAWFATITGTVNTSGTSVTWVSGVHSGGGGGGIVVGDFVTSLVGNTLTINGTGFTVSSCSSSITCTLGSSAGTQTGASFSFSLWTRPIMSGSNTVHKFLETASSIKFVTVDGIEWTDMFSNLSSPTSGQVDYIDISRNINSNIRITKNYFHGGNVAHDGAHAAHFIIASTGSGDSSNELDHNVFDNSDWCTAATPPLISGPTCTIDAIEGTIFDMHDNFIGYFSCGIVTDWATLIYENTMQVIVLSPDNGVDHENGIENNGGTGVLMFNNLVRHFVNNGIVDFQLAPVTSSSYGFNNVLPDMDGGNMEQCYEGAPANNHCEWFNNTAEAGPDSGTPSGVCGRNTGGNTTSTVTNQHCISTQTGTNWWTGSATFVTNLVQSKTTASGQGYTNASTYAFQPTSVSGGTVGTGTNKSSTCTTINGLSTIAGAACLQDTTYGVAYDSVSHIITGPGRSSTNPRPSSAAWDIGAYQFSSSTKPNPPVLFYMWGAE